MKTERTLILDNIKYFYKKVRGRFIMYKSENTFKGSKGKVKLNLKQKYTDAPVVVVFKSSNRKNAKTKIKVFNNKNIDDVLSNPQPGISDKAEILEIGVGKKFIEKYTKQYKL